MGTQNCKSFCCNDQVKVAESVNLTPNQLQCPSTIQNRVTIQSKSGASSTCATHRKSDTVLTTQVDEFCSRLSVVEEQIVQKSGVIYSLNSERERLAQLFSRRVSRRQQEQIEGLQLEISRIKKQNEHLKDQFANIRSSSSLELLQENNQLRQTLQQIMEDGCAKIGVHKALQEELASLQQQLVKPSSLKFNRTQMESRKERGQLSVPGTNAEPAKSAELSFQFTESSVDQESQPHQEALMDFEKYIEQKLKNLETGKENMEFTLGSQNSLSLSQIAKQSADPTPMKPVDINQFAIDSELPSRINESCQPEDSQMSCNQECTGGGQVNILAHLSTLREELGAMHQRIAETDVQRQRTASENQELKAIVEKLEQSVLRLGGNISDSRISIEGRKNTSCTDRCNLF